MSTAPPLQGMRYRYRWALITMNALLLLPIFMVAATAFRSRLSSSLPTGVLNHLSDTNVYLFMLLSANILFMLFFKIKQSIFLYFFLFLQAIYAVYLAITNLIFMINQPFMASSFSPLYSLFLFFCAALNIRFVFLNYNQK